jgi:hypothetical protein
LSQGNSYPDHLFQSARRLLHRIALNDGSRGDDRANARTIFRACELY